MKHVTGFTLLELLVTLAILGVVIIISGGFLTTDSAERERLLAHADDQRNTLLAAEILREQLTPAGSGLPHSEPRLSFACHDRAIEVYAHYIDTTTATPEERLFFFSVVTDRSGNRLTRGNYTPETYRKGPRQPIVQDIIQLTLVALTDTSGVRHEASNIQPAQEIPVAALEFSITGAGGATKRSTIFTPLTPKAWFQPTWGPACGQ